MQTMKLSMVDRQLLDEARRAFRPTPVTPGLSMDQVQYDAGAIKVLDWLDTKIAQTSSKDTMSAPEPVKLPDSAEGFLRRAMRGSQ